MSPEQMWEVFNSRSDTEKEYSSWCFCDNEKDANELVNLVLVGKKKATSSAYELYEKENEAIPKLGAYSVITDWSGKAYCVIKTTKVDVIPFNEVSEEFAYKEGEGDLSLEYWKRVHWDCFERELELSGLSASEVMLVVCEEFELVYK